MVIHVEPGRLRHDGDRPTAITDLDVTSPPWRDPWGDPTSDLLLGTPTCSARTRHGFWGLFQNGADVVVAHPGGAMIGPPADVAAELDRVGGAGQDAFTHAAARAILAFLTGPDTNDAGVPAVRTWSRPALGYWLSGPDNHPRHGQDGHGRPSNWPGAPTRPPAPTTLPGAPPVRHERPAPRRPAPRAA